MEGILLDLPGLRLSPRYRPRLQEPILDQVAAAPGAFHLTRRQMLKLTGLGMAAIGVATGVKTIEKTVTGPFKMVESKNRVAFFLDGEEKWVIDLKSFGGNPSLIVNRNDGLIRIELSGARFPGTDIPADFVCELKEGVTGWWMNLRHSMSGNAGEVSFEQWLAGAEPVCSQINLNRLCLRFGQSAALTLSGTATAEYYPDWAVKLTGPGIAEITGLGPRLVSDTVTLIVLESGAPSILNKPAAMRTLITVMRGNHEWPVKVMPSKGERWQIATDGKTFDFISLEAGLDRAGHVPVALLAESTGDEAKLSFVPGYDLVGHKDKPFQVALRNARYAMVSTPLGIQTALLAEYDKNPVWLHLDNCSLQLGDAPGTAPFEMIACDNKIMQASCAPALLKLAAPMPDAIVEPTMFPEGTRMTLLSVASGGLRSDLGGINPGQNAGSQILAPGTISLRPDLGGVSVDLPDCFSVSVIRPSDLLVLKFEFINLKLVGTNLVRANSSNPSYIIVHFPPQSISEQAFFESAPGFAPPKPGESGYDRSQSDPAGSETPGQPPVRSRIAGPSRLAFIVPQDVAQIPYSLNSLLDWSKFQPSVMLTAKPPESNWVGPESVFEMAAKPGTDLVPLIRSGINYRLPVDQKVYLPPPPINIIQPPVDIQPPTNTQPPTNAQPPQDIQMPKDVQLPVVVQPIQPNLIPGLTMDEIGPPLYFHTAIEAPYRLILSPHMYSGWKHSLVPVNHGIKEEPVEIWHTRLGVRKSDGSIDEKDERMRTLRAIWSPDYVAPPDGSAQANAPGHVNSPFRMSLDRRDRHEIVRLTADFHINTGQRYTPQPIYAEQFMLTSLGAWMRTRGAWDPPNSTELEIEAWQHRATMGRDHYVKVIYRGYLFPFGHRASLIKVTERKFQKSPGVSGARTAYLRQRMYVVVREPEKTYPQSGNRRSRQFPFRRVFVKTAATPAIDEPNKPHCKIESYGQQCFWPCVNNQPFQFHLIGEDWEGRAVEFSAPLIFVGQEYATNTSKKSDLDKINNHYASSGIRRKPMINGQKIAYAPSDKKGDTSIVTMSITLGAEIPVPNESFPSGQPRFFPTLVEAKVRLPEVSLLSGSDVGESTVKLPETYLNSGFDAVANKGAIFAEITGSKPNVIFRGDKAGALVKPNLAISGISRIFGPVGGSLNNLMGGGGGSGPAFKPSDFFSGDADLFGGFKLSDILPDIPLGDVLNDLMNISKIPGLTIKYEYEPGDTFLQFPIAVTIMYDWKPRVRKVTLGGLVSFDPKDPEKTLVLHAELRKNLKNLPEDPTFSLQTDIRNFTIDFIDIIAVMFDSLSFKAKSGEKPDVDVNIKDVQFRGCLEFVNELRNFMKSDGTGPYIDITGNGVEAGISTALPTVTMGMFSLQNMTLLTRTVIPFTGNPVMLYFAFCSRENPFLLSVGPFGGGGFFQIAVSMTGIQMIEASFEFGAACSFGIAGLASGKVYAMGGIYFRWEPAGMQFTAFLKIGGSLRIIGIVTVSVEFYMELSYLSKTLTGTERALLKGRATITVEIEVLFWSTSVELTVERQFDAGDPKFSEQVKREHWLEYCEAFV